MRVDRRTWPGRGRSERQVDIEMGGAEAAANNVNGLGGNAQQGTLSQTNLGASSLTLKILIWMIDTSAKRRWSYRLSALAISCENTSRGQTTVNALCAETGTASAAS